MGRTYNPAGRRRATRAAFRPQIDGDRQGARYASKVRRVPRGPDLVEASEADYQKWERDSYLAKLDVPRKVDRP